MHVVSANRDQRESSQRSNGSSLQPAAQLVRDGGMHQPTRLLLVLAPESISSGRQDQCGKERSAGNRFEIEQRFRRSADSGQNDRGRLAGLDERRRGGNQSSIGKNWRAERRNQVDRKRTDRTQEGALMPLHFEQRSLRLAIVLVIFLIFGLQIWFQFLNRESFAALSAANLLLVEKVEKFDSDVAWASIDQTLQNAIVISQQAKQFD